MNHNLLLLQNLYSSTSGKYLKFRHRFDKAIQSGRFKKLSRRKQSSLVSRLKKLVERLKSLQTQLRIAGAGVAFTLVLSAQAQSGLGPFIENGNSNPFPAPIIGNRPMPAIVDIDNDGDLDVFVGNYYPAPGNIDFYENVGGPNQAKRLEFNSADNPFAGINLGRTATPAFGDVDGDGDYDMLLGVYTYGATYSPTFFFRNTGTPTAPVFVQQTGASNPFNGITGGKYGAPHPVFVDIDTDLDADLFIASRPNPFNGQSSIRFFQNNAGVFAYTAHPLNDAAHFFYDTAPTFADLDNDGDLDALVGTHLGLYSFINNGSTFDLTNDPWDPVNRTGNPMHVYSNYLTNRSSPEFGDFDGDGDLDLLVGHDQNYYQQSNIEYYENTDGNFTFIESNDLNISPFGGVDVGAEASITFVDIDNDGDLDAVIGSKYFFDTYRNIYVYRNDDGEFVADRNHALNTLSYSTHWDVIYSFVDIDGDNDQDVFTGADYEILFYRNNNGVYEEETSPIDFYGNELSITFMDFDGDNDFDAFIGNQYGTLELPSVQYFENQGTPQVPDFALETAPVPFDTRNFSDSQSNEENPNVVSTDIDHDGDSDIIVSASAGYGDESIQTQVILFENNGDGTFTELEDEPVYVRIDELGYYNFFDLDGDGDLDAFAGTYEGLVVYLENTNPPPVTNVTSSILNVTGNEPTAIDPLLTIVDPDNDDITYATVSIGDFEPGDEDLSFDENITTTNGIVGEFNNQNGVLTFTGKATLAVYQNLLRSVTIHFTGVVPGGRKSNAGRVRDLAQDITFQVRDTDFTLTTVSVVSLNIVPGGPSTEINIYNALSPNEGDNANPFFKIEYIEAIFPENKVTIYNRWGDVVYEVTDYNNTLESKRFNGISKEGKELPTGTYFYKIDVGSKSIRGYLSLKR